VTVVRMARADPWLPWARRFVFCTLATLINPFGWQLWLSTGRALLVTRKGFEEWAPVSWWPVDYAYLGYKLLVVFFLASVITVLARKGWREIDRTALILMSGVLLLSLTSARHTSLFAAVAGALLPDLFPQELMPRDLRDPLHRLGFLVLRLSVLLVPLYSALMLFPGDGLWLRYPSVSCPVQAVDYLQKQGLQGRLLVPL
jgi:hypothetical protein